MNHPKEVTWDVNKGAENYRTSSKTMFTVSKIHSIKYNFIFTLHFRRLDTNNVLIMPYLGKVYIFSGLVLLHHLYLVTGNRE